MSIALTWGSFTTLPHVSYALLEYFVWNTVVDKTHILICISIYIYIYVYMYIYVYIKTHGRVSAAKKAV